MIAQPSQAIVTVSNSKFLKGTLVLFYSILKENPWFDGDFIVIENGLSEFEKEQLSVFKKLRFIQPSTALLSQLTILCHYFPSFKAIMPRFFSLETFNLTHYEQLLFLDSDILCTGNIQKLFKNDESPIVACYDYPYYLNKKRDFETFTPTLSTEQLPNRTYINAFNSGVMMINLQQLSPTIYTDLLKQVNPIAYSELLTSHTDQFILNRFFNGQVVFTSCIYNFLSHAQQAIEAKSAKNIMEATLIHFSKSPKPWDVNNDNLKAHFQLWNKVYADFLNQQSHEKT